MEKEISAILNLDRSIDPQQLILGTAPSRGLGKNKLYMLRVLMLIAHKMITVNCLNSNLPTLDQWVQRQAMNCMENITASLRLWMDIYLEKWMPVIMYLTKCTYCQYLTGQAGMKRTEPIKDDPSPLLPYMFFYLVYTCINVCHAVGDSLSRNLF